ncbi:MAG: hypothetical protein Q8R67_01845 [Rhodoferax sp.]|nr:hypothetical protein [Rhodoferax sp.]MDP3650402.1 hypothetical protein [Rhodoferax sp.]
MPTLLLAALFAAPLVFAAPPGAKSKPVVAKADIPPATKPAPLPTGVLGDIQLTQVRLDDAVRLLSRVGKANVVVTGKVADQIVSLYLYDTTVEDMVRNLCRAAGVWYRFDAASKTYIVMSGEEYQKDLAIVRDEQTRVFTLRHHNVVATANAIKALFGGRVTLSAPVEEMPPSSLGSGSRTSTSGGSKDGSASTGNSRTGGSTSGLSGGASLDQAQTSGGAGNARGGGPGSYDPASDLARLGQDRLGSQLRTGANGQALLSMADLQDMAARQGPPVYVSYNKLNNLLMVRTGDEITLKQIGQLVSDMDKPPKQVLLEMKILEVKLDNGFRSVFDIGFGSKGTTNGPLGIGALPSTSSNYAAMAGRTGLFGVEQNATAIWQIMSESLSLRFQLLAQENKLKVLSSPMLVAANNQQARLFIGDERVLTVGASSQSTTGTTGATNTQITVETEKRNVGQTLSILPRINGDRSISLTLDQDSSSVKLKDGSIPIATSGGQVIDFPIDTVSTASLQVTAHAQDGMTVAIGGMIRDSVQRDEEKVPLLGDLPVLGYLFKRDVRASVRSQMVLLITPRVLENPGESNSIAQAKTQDFNALAATLPSPPVVPKLSSTPAEPAVSETTSSAPPGHGEDTRFAALARAAAAAVRQKDPMAAPPQGLRALPLGDTGRWPLANGMEAWPRASWQGDGLYVTALQVSNTSAQPGALVPTLIRGNWAAMVLEKQQLDASGGADSWTWAYAISRLPFEQAVQRP